MIALTVDLPAPLDGQAIALFTTATAFLATVDWTHPNHDQEQQ